MTKGSTGLKLVCVRILLISVFYPPQNAIASQRAYAWAKYWSRAGEQVTVLTPTKDLSRADLSPQPTEGVRIVEVAPIGLFAALKKMVRRSAQTVGAVARADHAAGETRSRRGIRRRLLEWFTSRGLFSSTRMPDAFDLWVRPGLKAARAIDCDVVVSTFGPYAPLFIAYALKKRRPSLVWVCDFRDLWVKNHHYAGIPGFRWIEKRLERKFVLACDFVTTVSEGLADEMREDYPGVDVRVVPNGFDFEDLRKVAAERAFPDDGLRRLVYTGSVNLAKRDPSPLFEALRSLSSVDLAKLRLLFVGPNVDLVSELAARYGVEASLEIRPSVPRFEALRIQRDADRLLFLETTYEGARDGVLTGKLFEYMSSGTPVIGVGIEPSSAVGRLLKEFNAGCAYGRAVDDLRNALQSLAREPQSRERKQNPELARFSREWQAQHLLEIVKRRRSRS